MPMICLGALKQYACSSFTFTAPDSLDILQIGIKYVRLPRTVSQTRR